MSKPYGPQFGPKLCCSQMGPSWGQVALSWNQVGPKLPCWSKLTRSRANAADMLDGNDAFGRFCANMQNAQVFLGGFDPENEAPLS